MTQNGHTVPLPRQMTHERRRQSYRHARVQAPDVPVGSFLCPLSRDVFEERGHLPFQVLDASAIEGIRGLAGESSSIYSCIQIYKALTPPAPPSVSRRDGRTWASILCGIL